MPTQRWESCLLVAEVRWRRLALRCLVHVTRASWQIVLDPWQQTSSRIAQTECTHLLELLVHRANQWASMGGRQKTWRMRRHHELFPLSCIDRSQRSKSQNERKEERGYHDQSKEAHTLSRVLTPRRERTSHVQDATANFTSSTPLWDRFYVVVDGLSPEHRVR